MRPIRLKMKAFGSYAGETVVDFEKLTGGLYLISAAVGTYCLEDARLEGDIVEGEEIAVTLAPFA